MKPRQEQLRLATTETHLWQVFPDTLRDPGLLRSYYALMCPEECVQHQRFRFEKGRHEYLVTRALVRTVLSRYADVDPYAWRFSKNAYGRPEIAAPQGLLQLRFNLSHTDGLIVCLVALDREIGVDVENMTRRGETVEIADRFFSPIEATTLRALPEASQRYRFFEYWTLKEAYIKARGMGISLPLEQFSFLLDTNQPVRIAFDPRLADDPASWQFQQFRPTPRHQMAVAIRRKNEPDLAIRIKQTVPLVS